MGFCWCGVFGSYPDRRILGQVRGSHTPRVFLPSDVTVAWVRSCREFRRRGREVYGHAGTAVALQLHPPAWRPLHCGGQTLWRTCTQSGRRFKQFWEVTFCGVEDFEGIQKASKTKTFHCESMAIPGGSSWTRKVPTSATPRPRLLGPTLRIRRGRRRAQYHGGPGWSRPKSEL